MEDLQKNLRLYLLGLLPEKKSSQLETLILHDDETHEQFIIMEDGLIEEYLDGELTPEERAGFEKTFLAHPERQRKLALTKSLIGVANQPIELHTEDTDEPILWYEKIPLIVWVLLSGLVLIGGITFIVMGGLKIFG